MPANANKVTDENPLLSGQEGAIDDGVYTHLSAKNAIANFGVFVARDGATDNVVVGNDKVLGALIHSADDRGNANEVTGLPQGVRGGQKVAVAYKGRVIMRTVVGKAPAVGAVAYVDTAGLITNEEGSNMELVGGVIVESEGSRLGANQVDVRLTGQSPITVTPA